MPRLPLTLADKVAKLRRQRLEVGQAAVPDCLQGVSKERVHQVLTRLGLAQSQDLVDVVFALLDNVTDSWFPSPATGSTIADGATTAHLGCHVGILQRGATKLDREGRDYWIKPLRVIGAIEAVTLQDGGFVQGHPVPKSPRCAYRLSEGFRHVLIAPDAEWESRLDHWASDNIVRERLTRRAELERASRDAVGSAHAALIEASVHNYAEVFLPDYEVIYVDDGDGDRVTEAERARLNSAGVDLQLGDPMPDVLLLNRDTDRLWVIEAVTSDGEVDIHKRQGMLLLAERCGKAGVNFTTTYRTWREAAARQGNHGNIDVGTYIWIAEDPAKCLYVTSYDSAPFIETVPLFDQSPLEQDYTYRRPRRPP